MPDRTMIVGAAGSVGVLLLVLELVRRRRLREEYALLWLVTGAVLLLLSLSRPLLDTLAELTGIYYPPSALFLGRPALRARHPDALLDRHHAPDAGEPRAGAAYCAAASRTGAQQFSGRG